MILYGTNGLSHYRKVSKKLSFFGIRDSYGTTQLVVDSRTCGPEILAAMRGVSEESIILVEGIVRQRPEAQRRDVSARLLNHVCTYKTHKGSLGQRGSDCHIIHTAEPSGSQYAVHAV